MSPVLSRTAWIVSVMLASFALVPPAGARAAFVNGVEQFNGSNFDLTTWEGRYTLDTLIQWNETMAFDNRAPDGVSGGGRGEMVTVDPLVGVGQWVEAEVRITGATTISPLAALRLSTKTHVNNTNLDSHKLDVSISPIGSGAGIGGSQGQDRSGFGFNILPPGSLPDVIGTTYILRIERPSVTQARMSAFNADHQQIGTTVTHTLVGFPADMHVVVYSGQVAASFDNVTIGALPEPAAGISGCLVAAVVLLRRPRRERA